MAYKKLFLVTFDKSLIYRVIGSSSLLQEFDHDLLRVVAGVLGEHLGDHQHAVSVRLQQ